MNDALTWPDPADLPVPGCAHFDERGPDPCEPASASLPYVGNAVTPLDVVDDYGWIQCPCADATAWRHPAHDCPHCLGFGVLVALSDDDLQPKLCENCAGEVDDRGYVDDTLGDCPTCLGTGHEFARPRLSYDEFREWQRQEAILSAQRAAYEAQVTVYLHTVEATGLLPPTDLPPSEGKWQLRTIVLESQERRPCGHCNDGLARVNGTLQRCTTCKATGSLPVATGTWLCEVDVNTAYYENDRDGKLHSDPDLDHWRATPGWTLRFGNHSPRYLPTERYVPFHRNDAVRVRPRRPHTIAGVPTAVPARANRTSDGVVHPVERWRDDEYEYYASSDSLLRALTAL
jgi:hypothetical protein